MKDTSFHGENLRRRARYIAVFSGLVIAFAVTVVLNINTGNVHISVPKILRILFLRDRGGNGIQYYLENPPSENPDGSDAGRSLIFVRFPFADIFCQSHCRTVCPWNFFRGKNGRSTDDDHFLKYIGHFSSYTLIVAAFIGSLISTGFILLMSKKYIIWRHCWSGES